MKVKDRKNTARAELFDGLQFAVFFKDDVLEKCSTSIDRIRINKTNLCKFVKAALLGEIDLLVRGPIIYEINATSENGKLIGNTPEKRYIYFSEQFSKTSLRQSFYKKYPTLKKKLDVLCLNFTLFLNEFTERFENDLCLIKKHFKLDNLCNLEVMGDSHAGGRKVLRLTLLATDSAQEKYLIYKPRNVTAEVAYNDLCGWFEKNLNLEFKTQKILPYKGYGYCEFIDHLSCNSADEIRRYFYRLGIILTICHITGLNDLHYENIIPSGEFPVIVDTECMLPPYIKKQNELSIEEEALPTVLDHMLLPGKFFFMSQNDLSAIGADLIIKHESQDKILLNEKTDRLKIEERQGVKQVKTARPSLNNQEIDPYNYLDNIKLGFSDAYRLIIKNLDLIKNDKITVFKYLKTCKTRVLFRNTLTYRKYQLGGYHPMILHSKDEKAKFYLNFYKSVELFPNFKDIVACEINEIENGDIPIFYAYADQAAVFNVKNKLNIAVELSGYDYFKYKIEKIISENDLFKQKSIIDNSFIAYKLSKNGPTLEKPKLPLNHELYKADERAIIKVILNDLNNLLMETRIKVTWPTVELFSTDLWTSSLADVGIYSGTTGIGLLYLSAYTVMGGNEYLRVAEKCLLTNLDTRLRFLSYDCISKDPIFRNPGLYTGVGGLIYGLYCLYRVEQKQKILKKILEMVDILEISVSTSLEVDILSGLAGALHSIILIKDLISIEKFNSLSNLILEKLFTIYEEPSVLPINYMDKKPFAYNKSLIGFSHGTSGIIWVLNNYLKKNSANEYFNEKIITWINKALAYERKYYSFESNNWPRFDIMHESDKYNYSTAWCHGAPGVGLSRFCLSKYDDHINEEIYNSVKSTINYMLHGHNTSFCLCHGDYGNLDFLYEALKLDKNLITEKQLDFFRDRTLNKIIRSGYKSGIVANGNSLSVMVGVAGIAYQLLRFSKSDLVPSLLSPM